jgi:hypothetical protein
MSSHHDPHSGLHSEQGALAGEHPGRAASPLVKVHELAWLEFTKPDLDRAELFGRAFGFQTAMRGPNEVQLRGSDPGRLGRFRACGNPRGVARPERWAGRFSRMGSTELTCAPTGTPGTSRPPSAATPERP